MSLYNLGNARNLEQAARMRRLESAGTCIFCPGHVDRPDDSQIVLVTTYWVVRHNDFPYAGTRLHLLLVPRQHVADLLDLPEAALTAFWRIVQDMRTRFGLAYYGVGARCGDCRYTGGTMEHVHVHLVVGDVDEPEHVPVRLKLSSRPVPPAPQQTPR